MIAKIRRGSYFRGLQSYLLSEIKGVSPEDIELRCLVSVDTASAEMHLAAGRSKRTQRAVYHIILAWAEEERPSRDEMFAIGHELLESIDLAAHQALLCRHTELKAGLVPGAGRHFELHIMVNRVGPDGRAAAMRNDYATVERAVAEIAAAREMRVVPGRFNDEPCFVQGSSETARSVASATGRLSPAMELRADPDAMAELIEARDHGWTALAEAFARRGYALVESDRKARAGQSAGLVMVDLADEERREKISALDAPDLKWGRPTLERDLGPFNVAIASAVAIAAGEARKMDGAQVQRPRLASERKAFFEARDRAMAERRRISEAHIEERRRLVHEQAQDRKRLLSVAAERRRRLRSFFGRGSEVGTALNRILDIGSADRFAKRKAAHDRNIQELKDRHRRELSLVSVPTWAGWNRSPEARDPEMEAGSHPSREQAPGSASDANTVRHDDMSHVIRQAAATLAIDAEEHEARAERLKRNRERKAALRRGDLDARVAAVINDLSVTVAAGVLRHLRSRHGPRTVLLILGALAAGSGIAPVVLAAAAAALLRRGVLKAERADLRADADAAKAARTGWKFADVTPADRVRYAALVRSDFITPGGSDAGPLIAAIDREQAARFVAWWAYATPKQRTVVERWDRPRPKPRPRSAPRPAPRRFIRESGR